MLKKILVFLLILILCFSSSASAENIVKLPKVVEIENYLFQYVNEERHSLGLPDLKRHRNLTVLARSFSQDMVDNNYYALEHEDLQGRNPSERAVAKGYECNRTKSDGWNIYGIGENINVMPFNQFVTFYADGSSHKLWYVDNSSEEIAKATFATWMNSSGHRSNIVYSYWEYIGIGVADRGKDFILVQEFW